MSRILFPKKTPSKKTPLTEAPTAHPSAKYVLSLDVGTTGIRALILDNQSQVKKTSYVKVSNTLCIYKKYSQNNIYSMYNTYGYMRDI